MWQYQVYILAEWNWYPSRNRGKHLSVMLSGHWNTKNLFSQNNGTFPCTIDSLEQWSSSWLTSGSQQIVMFLFANNSEFCLSKTKFLFIPDIHTHTHNVWHAEEVFACRLLAAQTAIKVRAMVKIYSILVSHNDINNLSLP